MTAAIAPNIGTIAAIDIRISRSGTRTLSATNPSSLSTLAPGVPVRAAPPTLAALAPPLRGPGRPRDRSRTIPNPLDVIFGTTLSRAYTVDTSRRGCQLNKIRPAKSAETGRSDWTRSRLTLKWLTKRTTWTILLIETRLTKATKRLAVAPDPARGEGPDDPTGPPHPERCRTHHCRSDVRCLASLRVRRYGTRPRDLDAARTGAPLPAGSHPPRTVLRPPPRALLRLAPGRIGPFTADDVGQRTESTTARMSGTSLRVV
jgi:hypothetical protein